MLYMLFQYRALGLEQRFLQDRYDSDMQITVYIQS